MTLHNQGPYNLTSPDSSLGIEYATYVEVFNLVGDEGDGDHLVNLLNDSKDRLSDVDDALI